MDKNFTKSLSYIEDDFRTTLKEEHRSTILIFFEEDSGFRNPDFPTLKEEHLFTLLIFFEEDFPTLKDEHLSTILIFFSRGCWTLD